MALPGYLEDTAKDYAKQISGTYKAPIETSTFTGGLDASGQRAAGPGITGINPYVAGKWIHYKTSAISMSTSRCRKSYQTLFTQQPRPRTGAPQELTLQAGLGTTAGGLGAGNRGSGSISAFHVSVSTGCNRYLPNMNLTDNHKCDNNF